MLNDVALVAWDRICRPKNQGGLNIKRCTYWNIASVGKLIWMLMEKDDILWVKWVNGVYMNNGVNFWTESPPADCSWYWRVLHKMKKRMQG